MQFTKKPLWRARLYRKRMTHIWSANAFLAIIVIGLQLMNIYLPGLYAGKASESLTSESFDGVISPIAQVPNWAKGNTDKKLRFDDISKDSLMVIPPYDPSQLSQVPTTAAITNARYTYITPYMGSYRGNYQEHDGSHLGVDIRAPLGTPVVAVANAIVSRIKVDPSGDGIYVVLRHDGVPLLDGNTTLYSAYLHLEDASVTLGQKLQKGTVIGHVGMTGITTTPHLHFQLDKSDAPFHPYWPYNGADMRSAGLSFFEGVNTGLGKEKALAYSYHPMDFINGKLTKNSAILASAPLIPPVSHSLLADDEILSKPSVITKPAVSNRPSESLLAQKGGFSDIDTDSSLKVAVTYLRDKGVVNGYPDGSFGIARNVTRKEAVLLVSRLFGIYAGESATTRFDDIPTKDSFANIASRFADLGILKAQKNFRPNDIVTKGELATMLVRASALSPVASPNFYNDVADSNSLRPYLNSYALQTNTSGNFSPSVVLTRGQTAEMLYSWAERGKGGFALNLD